MVVCIDVDSLMMSFGFVKDGDAEGRKVKIRELLSLVFGSLPLRPINLQVSMDGIHVDNSRIQT